MRKIKNDKTKNSIFLTAKDASDRLGIPLSTLYRLSNQGSIKSMHIGGRWYYPKDEIEKYLSCEQSIQSYSTRDRDLPERRSYPRINCQTECDYSIDLPENYKVFKGIIRNISGGGLLLYDKYNIDNVKVDDPIKLELRLNLDGNNETLIQSKGRIVRKANNGCGVKFRDLNKESQNLIKQFVG